MVTHFFIFLLKENQFWKTIFYLAEHCVGDSIVRMLTKEHIVWVPGEYFHSPEFMKTYSQIYIGSVILPMLIIFLGVTYISDVTSCCCTCRSIWLLSSLKFMKLWLLAPF